MFSSQQVSEPFKKKIGEERIGWCGSENSLSETETSKEAVYVQDSEMKTFEERCLVVATV